MWILILVICIVAFIGGVSVIDDHDELGTWLSIGALLIGIVDVVLIISCLVAVVKSPIIDDKIAMYTEENAKIEESIDALVSNYMEYESETFIELQNDDAMTVVSLYPELKSDELVMAQINTYQANNAKIKELKESKINLRGYKWWLYFGK